MHQSTENLLRQSLKEAVFSLCSVMTVSGFESRSADLLCRALSDSFDEIRTDAVGNLFLIRRCAKENAPLICIDTHYDEIGMMVTGIEDNGFVRFTSVGGLSPTVLQGADVILYGRENLRGVISSTPPHLRQGESDRLPPPEELLIDTGYDKETISERIDVGTPVGFAPCYRETVGGLLLGKSFDNKACAAVALHAVVNLPKEELAADVALCFSRYEETSRLGGIAPAAFDLKPDYAMVIDVNLATVPDVPKRETVPCGKGISLSVSAATDRKLTRMTEALCRQEEIPHCLIAAPSSTGTNAPTLQLTGHGIPTVDVGLPLKFMHTYNEAIDLSDAEALYRLVVSFVRSKALAETFAETDFVEKEGFPV